MLGHTHRILAPGELEQKTNIYIDLSEKAICNGHGLWRVRDPDLGLEEQRLLGRSIGAEIDYSTDQGSGPLILSDCRKNY